MLTLEEVRSEIAKSGIPESLLTGETIEEVIAQAKALLAWSSETGGLLDADRRPAKTTREMFSEWAASRLGRADPQQPAPDLDALQQEALQLYPETGDGGEAPAPYEPRDKYEEFADWVAQSLNRNLW